MVIHSLRKQTHIQKGDRRPEDVLQRKLYNEILWIDGLCNPPWVVYELAARALAQTQDRNASSTISSFVASLRDCGRNKDLRKGIQVHNALLKCGLVRKCSDALLTMYAKCGELAKAREFLDAYESRNVFTWNALISLLIQKGQEEDALHHFEQMHLDGVCPDAATFSCILKACASLRALAKGEKCHDQIARLELLQNNAVLGTSLINMYAKCGALTKARTVLEELPVRNAFSWSAMIAGYADHGDGKQALTCFKRMQLEGFSPDSVTLISVLKACSSIKAIDEGKEVHDEIAKQGLLRGDAVLGTALVDMYAKCGALSKARHVLDELSTWNGMAWNALISGYAQHGECEEALRCLNQMQCNGFFPTVVTYTSVLKACSSLRMVEKGQQIHDEISRKGLLKHSMILGNALINMYVKCDALGKAAQVLNELPTRNVVTWSTLIAGHAQLGRAEQAFQCFDKMLCDGFFPNVVTFICLLGACSEVGAAHKGVIIHNEIAKRGLLKGDIILGDALVSMYAKCGMFAKAREMLEKLPVLTVVSWNSLIAGYLKYDKVEQALTCFQQMEHKGISPDTITFICILNACGIAGALGEGKRIHCEIATKGLLASNVMLGTSLVSMYSKCGALALAWEVLETLPARNASTWNAFITGSVILGEGEKALTCFEQMQREDFSPDAATFSCLLGLCSRLGLLKEGYIHFSGMNAWYGVGPDLEHYLSMIDLFARSGHLNKASGIMHKVPSFCMEGWFILLGACQKWGGFNVGRWAFESASKQVVDCL